MVVPASSDGHVGAVVIHPRNGSKAVVLNKPYVVAGMKDRQMVETAAVDPKNVDDIFGSVRKSLPRKPVTFYVFFVESTDTLQPEAKRVMDRVITEIGSREAADVTVIGHTDFLGSDEYNDRLSLLRAEKVRDQLVRRGVTASIVNVAGRGKRDPLVATTSAEQQNRRVEITVR